MGVNETPEQPDPDDQDVAGDPATDPDPEDAAPVEDDVDPAVTVGDITQPAAAVHGDPDEDVVRLGGEAERRGPAPALVLAGILLVLALVIGGGVFLASGSGDGPAFQVGDDATSVEDLATSLDELSTDGLGDVARAPEEGDAQQRSVLAQFMSSLIVEDILTREADARGVEVAEADVDAELDSLLEEAFGGDQAAFDDVVSQSGLTAEGVRQQIRTTLLVERLTEDDLGGIEVTDAEVQEIYDAQFATGNVSHILTETEEEAQAVLDRLESGEDFATVAAEVSLDTGSAAQGGALGPFVPGSFVEEFEDAVVATDPGDLTGPVETQFGFHVITVEEPPALEEVRDQIAEGLRAQALDVGVQDLLADLDEAYEVTVGEAYGTWSGLLGGGVQPPAVDPTALEEPTPAQ